MFASQPGKRPMTPTTSLPLQPPLQSPSSSSSSWWWSRLGGWLGVSSGSKSPSPEERYRQALVEAKMFVENSNARVARAMEQHHAVANSNYWFYGYFGANMMAAVALCLAAGNRVTLLRRYSGWCGLAWGYVGGTACLNAHKGVLLGHVVQQIDREVAEARQRDAQTDRLVPDYTREARRLEALKASLMPHLRSQHAAEQDASSDAAHDGEAYSPDMQADELVNNYMRRRKALAGTHRQ